MREIKLRAWNRKLKKMITPGLEIKDIGLGDGSVVAYGEETQDGNELDWMQFLGFKDKNGRDIYEGDIVRDFSQGGKEYILFWCNECAGYSDHVEKKHGKTLGVIPYASVAKEAIEVIGNVYECPNLAKKLFFV